jgi:hypothetical protein
MTIASRARKTGFAALEEQMPVQTVPRYVDHNATTPVPLASLEHLLRETTPRPAAPIQPIEPIQSIEPAERLLLDDPAKPLRVELVPNRGRPRTPPRMPAISASPPPRPERARAKVKRGAWVPPIVLLAFFLLVFGAAGLWWMRV